MTCGHVPDPRAAAALLGADRLAACWRPWTGREAPLSDAAKPCAPHHARLTRRGAAQDGAVHARPAAAHRHDRHADRPAVGHLRRVQGLRGPVRPPPTLQCLVLGRPVMRTACCCRPDDAALPRRCTGGVRRCASFQQPGAVTGGVLTRCCPAWLLLHSGCRMVAAGGCSSSQSPQAPLVTPCGCAG
jgi:hypothetical protein